MHKNTTTASEVPRFFLKPNCLGNRMLLLLIKDTNLLYNNFSVIRFKTGRPLIGLELFTWNLSPDLKTGLTQAVFKVSDKSH